MAEHIARGPDQIQRIDSDGDRLIFDKFDGDDTIITIASNDGEYLAVKLDREDVEAVVKFLQTTTREVI